ncbi:MAG: nucleotidyl transferase AbiEii/AbiGii toxin family protein [Candidatus Cyclonatronum sp.]|uniref:nucleotidyl transferase AbiEii/AbiGii toxin family protein n=1 Tax=Cyclonatronum sp. TaxID=3024185 RepID=UPI0025BA48A3|nr:nucleotidyl transferase AbiEii/AbiGii toxin family protein [Cyclonatronum sp.]MCH8485853.1 nucleotidyl transferase AbiEii/AbiGii toxin family protein [Cyclonatronum sp.]
MNTSWLSLPKQRRVEILNQVTERTGLPAAAIEKDWWVTLCLKACFELPYSEQLLFKGGTSLSKAWGLIHRFSEDIDLAIDRSFFGYEGDISKTQIKKLRQRSCGFISNQFIQDLRSKLTKWGAISDCELIAQAVTNSDKDPQTIEIHYHSVTEPHTYLPQRVLIEVSSRSLMEPAEVREIHSVLSSTFPKMSFAEESFKVMTVTPQKTFLEKIFLLHEEFSQVPEKIRTNRLSRHLYDIEKVAGTGYGNAALQNPELYQTIVAHRKKFNSLRGLDYSNHTPDKIRIIPPETVIREYENDYSEMAGFMIYEDALTFQELIKRIRELQNRINAIS